MKIYDYLYFKKSGLIKYTLSTELHKHREEVKNEKKQTVNDVVIPLFSAISSLIIAEHSLSPDHSFKGALIRLMLFAGGFILTYQIIDKVIIKVFDRVNHFYKDRKVPHEKNFKTDQKKKVLIDMFNYRIINQLVLSYELINAPLDEDLKLLRKFQISEAINYLDSALVKLKEITSESRVHDYFNGNFMLIKKERISLAYDLSRESLEVLKDENENQFSSDIHNIVTTYNNQVSNLNSTNLFDLPTV